MKGKVKERLYQINLLVNASNFYSQKHRSMIVERRFDPSRVSKMLVKWSKCSSFYSQRTSKKERKSLIISDMIVFFLYPVAPFTCFLPLLKRKGMITSWLVDPAS